jgi:hypothetical protein
VGGAKHQIRTIQRNWKLQCKDNTVGLLQAMVAVMFALQVSIADMGIGS